MEIKKKIQLGAATVMVNGVLALFALNPSAALATSCGPVQYCGTTAPPGMCFPSLISFCQSNTPSGCTYASTTCTTTNCQNTPPLVLNYFICNYT